MQLTEAIVETRNKIEGDICRRRTILDALDFVTRTGWLIHVNTKEELLTQILEDKSRLAYDMLREAPLHLR